MKLWVAIASVFSVYTLAPASGAAFEPLAGVEGGTVHSLAATSTRQFAGTTDGLYARTGQSGPWSLLFRNPNNYLMGIHVWKDTLIVHESFNPSRYSLDNGETWQVLAKPDVPGVAQQNWKVASFGRLGLFMLAGTAPKLMRSMDYGKTWQAIGREKIHSVVEWEAGLAVAVADSGVSFLDLGTGVLTPLGSGLPPGKRLQLAGFGNILIATDGDYGFYRYRVESKDWVATGDPRFRSPISSWVKIRFQSNTIFMGLEDSLRGYVCLRSTDQALTWQVAARFPWGTVEDLMPAGPSFLASVRGRGVARHDPEVPGSLLPDNQGMYADRAGVVLPVGGRLYASMKSSGWTYRSDDRGKTWTLIADRTGGLTDLGRDILFHGTRYLGRIPATGKGYDSLPLPPGDVLWQLRDGGDRIYALAANPGVHGGHITYSFSSTGKDAIRWEHSSCPCEMGGSAFFSWEAKGAMPLALTRGNLNRTNMSRDGGVNWTVALNLPFTNPNAVRLTQDKWLVSSEAGLFSADDPEGPWTRLASDSPDTLLASAGSHLVGKSHPARYRYSPDLGATWSDLVPPHDPAQILWVALSEDLLCITHSYSGEIHCSDLETLPISARRSASARKERASPLLFEGGWKVIQAPAAPGGLPRTFDFLGRNR